MTDRERFETIDYAREHLPAPKKNKLGDRHAWEEQPPAPVERDASPIPPPPEARKKIVFQCIYSYQFGYVWEIYSINF